MVFYYFTIGQWILFPGWIIFAICRRITRLATSNSEPPTIKEVTVKMN